MPAYMVHRIAGEKVLKQLHGDPVKEINSFIPGLQGADLFFFYNYNRPIKKKVSSFGSKLHSQKTKEFFTESMQYIKAYTGSDREELVSYFCGYIAHYCVDKRLHPFVFERTHDFTSHNGLEFMLDALYIQDELHMDASKFNIFSDLFREPLKESIGAWYTAMDKKLYGFGITKGIVRRSFHCFAHLRKSLQQPGLYFFAMARVMKLLTRNDARAFMHPKKTTWDYFTQEEYAYLKALIEEAATEAAQKIEDFVAWLRDEKTLDEVLSLYQNINFKGETLD